MKTTAFGNLQWTVALTAICLVAAGSASAQITFTQVQGAAGLGAETYGSKTAHGLGVLWIDYNNDGWPDVFATNGQDNSAHLYRNNANATFTLVDQLLPALPNVELTGAMFADYDNDGDQDIYVYTDNEALDLAGENEPDGPPNLLLKNLWVDNGNQTISGQPLFVNVAAMAGVDDLAPAPFGSDYPAYRSISGGWLDYNRDGYVDLYVAHWVLDAGGEVVNIDRLFKNNGNGTFSDVTVESNVNPGTDPDTMRPALAFIAAHLDSDNWQDLYVVNVHDSFPFEIDQYYTNNRDGTFTENFGNTQSGPGDDSGAGMGATVADIDRDGDWDLYLSDQVDTIADNSQGNTLYLGNGDGTFTDNVHQERMLDDFDGDVCVGFPEPCNPGVTSWGVTFFDADNDGWEDLFVGAAQNTDLNNFYRNNGDGTFTEMATAAGIDFSGGVRGAATADYDGDGDLDVLTINQTQFAGLVLFRNNTVNQGNFLKINLHSALSNPGAFGTNRSAIGAMIRVREEVGGLTQRRQIIGGYSTHSQDSLVAHFGTGNDTDVFNVRVTWPSGMINSINNVPANQTLDVFEATGRSLAFVNVTDEAGFDYSHGYTDGFGGPPRRIAGGVAAGDFDKDGWVDLYAVRGNVGPNLLFRNMGDGTFLEMGALAGVDLEGHIGSGPTFGDYDGDGDLDLVLGAADNSLPKVYENLGDSTFVDVTASTGITTNRQNTFSVAFIDYNNDGLMDITMGHWGDAGAAACTPSPCTGHLWKNNGDGTFSDDDVAAGITGYELEDRTFTPNWADVNNDGWLDLLFVGDFNTSMTHLNDGDGTFTNTTDEGVLTDTNGMGGTFGDYDHDGDIDWFVSSIFEEGGTRDGDRLYRNLGDGTFEDATTEANVRNGYWGWGACMQDFDNDGHLDILHTNGFGEVPYDTDPTVLFMSNADGTFAEMASELGITDNFEGRGVVCFDYDKDGDLDVFVANNSAPPVFYRNDGGNVNNWLGVTLKGRTKNSYGVGARLYATAGGLTHLRQMTAGSNFTSQQPAEVLFGFGNTAVVSELKVKWPNGVINTLRMVPTRQYLEIKQAFDSIGSYLAGNFQLRNDNAAGPADDTFVFGPTGGPNTAISGDWDGDGLDTVGVFNVNQTRWRLAADDGSTFAEFDFGPGGVNWAPIAGDWDGDGIDTIGVFDLNTFQFQLRNSNSAGPADIIFNVNPSGTGWRPVAGDWDGDGVDSVGVFRNARFLLKNSNGPGGADVNMRIDDAGTGNLPVTGDWDGDGIDSAGVYNVNSATYRLRNALTTGNADLTFVFGDPGRLPIAGEWN